MTKLRLYEIMNQEEIKSTKDTRMMRVLVNNRKEKLHNI